MESAAEPVPHMNELPPADKTVRWDAPRVNRRRSPSPGSDTTEEPMVPSRDIDAISIDSAASFPDFTGRRLVTFDDERITTAYEAWELVYIEDGYTRQSWSSFCGIKYSTKWVKSTSGDILLNDAFWFDQGELADMHEDAVCGYKGGQGTDQEKAYQQDLANRVYDLPADVYDKIQHLLEDKTNTTNKNPYRRREWRVVVLQPGEFPMTERLPERKRKHPFARKKEPATRTWFVVLRGQEVKATKEEGGWKAHNRFSNPWWRLDRRETKEERSLHKDMMKRADRAHDSRRRSHGPRFS